MVIIFDAFEKSLMWKDSQEMCWYDAAVQALAKENLLEEDTLFEYYLSQIRQIALIMIYQEFCQLQYDEICFYDFSHLLEYTDIEDLHLGLIAGMSLEQEYIEEYLEEGDTNQILNDVLETMRNEVFNALVEHMGEGSVDSLYVSMVAAYWNNPDIDEEIDNDGEVQNEGIDLDVPNDECDKYKRIIEEFAEQILNDDDFNSQEAYDWLSSGTYRLEEY